MEFDKKNKFKASLTFDDKACSLVLLDLKENQADLARSIISDIEGWVCNNLRKIKEYVASELIVLKNEDWLGDDEEPITLQGFMEIIDLDGIIAFSNGSSQLFFDDHDLFAGHNIMVNLDENFTIRLVDIVG